MNWSFPSLSLAAISCWVLLSTSGCSQPSAAETQIASPAGGSGTLDRVRAGQPERKTLTLYTSQPGRVEAYEETPLFPKVNGYVDHVLVDIGDPVQKNQKLIQLWIPEMQDELEQKEALVAQSAAEVQQAEAAVQAADARVNTAKARVNQAEAGIGRSESDVARWKSEYERLKELVSKGSVTQKLADETLNQFRSAESARTEAAAMVESAKAEWNEAQANAAKSRADLVAIQAKLRVSEANLKQTKTLVAYAEIKAPFDGIVTRRSVDTGHYVHPANSNSSTPLLVIARTDKVRVCVDVPEMEAPLVDKGDAAMVRVQSLRNPQVEATITRTSWSLNAANRSLRAELDIPNPDGLLRPGMYATVTIHLDEQSGVLALPITAIVKNGLESYCCCVESGQIQRKTITLGLRSGNEVEIRSGLDGQELVVLAQAELLQPAQKVEVITPPK